MCRILIALLFASLLSACASAPKVAQRGIPTERELTPVRDEAYARADRFLDIDAVLAARSATLPQVDVAEGAAAQDVSADQAALVANRAAREVCNALAPHLAMVERDGDLEIALRVVAVQPTSRGAAGVSEVIGFFVPGPFRLPAGLGGLAIDGVARDDGSDVLVLHWAEGANAVTEGARISTIGDAYQLAGQFASDFARALVDPRGKDGETRARLDPAQREANKALCRARFGSANLAGRGASILLPLAPEAIDDGAPAETPQAVPAADAGSARPGG
jgi:hypothetical protein